MANAAVLETLQKSLEQFCCPNFLTVQALTTTRRTIRRRRARRGARDRRLDLAETSVHIAQDSLDAETARLGTGTKTPLDVLEAGIDLDHLMGRLIAHYGVKVEQIRGRSATPMQRFAGPIMMSATQKSVLLTDDRGTIEVSVFIKIPFHLDKLLEAISSLIGKGEPHI